MYVIIMSIQTCTGLLKIMTQVYKVNEVYHLIKKYRVRNGLSVPTVGNKKFRTRDLCY